MKIWPKKIVYEVQKSKMRSYMKGRTSMIKKVNKNTEEMSIGEKMRFCMDFISNPSQAVKSLME